MPLQKCGEGNKGWRWGKSGKCYTGPGAKRKAIKQGVAIEGPDKFAEKASREEFRLLPWSDRFFVLLSQGMKFNRKGK